MGGEEGGGGGGEDGGSLFYDLAYILCLQVEKGLPNTVASTLVWHF